MFEDDPIDEEAMRAFVAEVEADEGDEWQWVSCGQPDCNVCAALREEFPHREANT